MAKTAPDLRPTDGRDVDECRDPATGRFMPGYKGGRKHRIDLRSACDRLAREEGRELEPMLWEVVKGLMFHAALGDVAAAKLLFDHFTVIEPVSAKVEVNVGLQVGPPIPDSRELATYCEELSTIAGNLRRSARITVAEIDPAVAETLEELLG